jgi:hypothetical protein
MVSGFGSLLNNIRRCETRKCRKFRVFDGNIVKIETRGEGVTICLIYYLPQAFDPRHSSFAFKGNLETSLSEKHAREP